ncbi:MAG: phosphotyrosine protein phosphatase [Lachnospiraceae bacterium]|nr:phosphotyrosine protein phosphatase [Lachnospiraceae bacterium]MDD3795309.1 phosphotyrosine protein phosphatase [Lachnospiraceae bacterium]
MKRYDKLIFVSGSDTSTSPMAEAILQSKYLLEDILVESRGLVVLFPEPVNPKVEAVLVSNGLTMKEHASEPLEKVDFDERTLVLTMDSSQKEKILSEYPEAVNVYTLAGYIKRQEDVSDPCGGDLSEYGKCFEQLKELITQLVIVLNEEELML